MFKTLRRKFVVSSVATVAIVIIIVAGALNYINYIKVNQKTDEILQQYSNNKSLNAILNDDSDSIIINSKNVAEGTGAYYGFSAIKLENGELKKYFNDDVLLSENNEINNYIEKAVKKDSDKGFIEKYRYLKVKEGNVIKILLLNSERELAVYFSFFKSSILVSAIVIFSVLVLMILISKKVVAPIEQSYIKQKQFITDASHELKTPLTIINSNTDVLELEHGESKWTKNIQNQVDRLTSLVNSLVIFSRMEEKETLEKTSFSLSNTLKNRIEDFEELASFQSKEIVADIDEVSYKGEQQTIIQLFDILLENATKYAPKDSKISISLKKNRKLATLKISNNANLVKGDLSKVFDRFYRLDESRNSDIKGYGIGLSLAKVIVEKHKEQIKAYCPEDGIFEISVKFTLNNEIV